MSKTIIKISDTETVVTGDPKQEETEAWSIATIRADVENIYDEVMVFGDLKYYIQDLYTYKAHVKDYFLNLKFDGSFIIDWLLKNGYKLSTRLISTEEAIEAGFNLENLDKNNMLVEKNNVVYAEVMATAAKYMENDTFTTLISGKGIWYGIKIKHNGYIYEMVDALKLLPFSLKAIGKGFDTLHKKLEMVYEDTKDHAHYAGCKITEEEMKYIKNDVLVLKEALNIMFEEGHEKLTIGSCCLSEFKEKYGKLKFDDLFPKVYTDDFKINPNFGADTVGDYVRKSYKGGWCYLRPEKSMVEFNNGTTCDVNSLYPSMMHSESGNRYPIGDAHFFKGSIPKDVENNDELYYFVRVKTRFYLKERRLPCIQIKPDNDHWLPYPLRTWLETSDYVDDNGIHWKYINDDLHGNKRLEMIPEMTFTKTDWELVQYCYDLEDTEILDGCWFYTRQGIFDEYINKYAEIKMKAKGAKRQIAKLFLNNLYGKFATSTDASYKLPYLGDDDIVKFKTVEVKDIKRGAYIPIGSAITSYARNFTIRAAIANYDTFIYADTDSIHCSCGPDEIIGCPEDPVKFNHWKYEACWDKAIFTRAKTYIEHVTHENREPVDNPYYNVKCAGMPERAKNNFIAKLENHTLTDDMDIKEYEKEIGVHNLTPTEISFHKNANLGMKDFDIGLAVPGSLKPKRVRGGVILFNNLYVMRPSIFC